MFLRQRKCWRGAAVDVEDTAVPRQTAEALARVGVAGGARLDTVLFAGWWRHVLGVTNRLR
jgi:hypothetical protein